MQPPSNILNERYKLIHQAGTGGMATVYKGQDLVLGRLVAVKVLHPGLTGDPEFLHRFQKEAHSAANLAHPNIVTVHDIGQDDRRYYIVMEYVEGWSLKDLIRAHLSRFSRPLSVERTIDLIIQICAGVGYAHRAGLVHCDVKAQNMLVTRDSRVKVTDFGIARALSEISLHDDSIVWGTPQYFSPEQAAGKRPTPASDVYSIGVIMFEMLTGRLPFEAESHTALAVKHMQDEPPPVTQYNPAVPPQLEQIIAKVLSKEPAGRYRTADQLGRVLSSYRQASQQDTGPIVMAATTAVAVSELETDPDLQASATPTSKSREASLATATTASFQAPVSTPLDDATDLTGVILGILALISLLGLIPLWYLVYLRFTG